MHFIMNLLSRMLPLKYYERLVWSVKFVVYRNFRQNCIRKEICGKENCDKNFYVLRNDNYHYGILSAYLDFLCEVEWAINRGYIPIVDLKNYYLPSLQNSDKKNKENAWDYYFTQPQSQYSLEEIYRSKNVILGWKNGSFPYKKAWMAKPMTESEVEHWHYFSRKYFDFSDNIKERANVLWNEKVPKDSKVLGICIRASFYRGELLGQQKYLGHPKQAGLRERIEQTRMKMKNWDCEFVFVSVDDREWLEEFKQYFGEKCIYVDRPLFHLFVDGAPVSSEDQQQVGLQEFNEISVQQRTEDYLTEIYSLTLCNSLFHTMTSGGTLAQIYKGNGYDNCEVDFKGQLKFE